MGEEAAAQEQLEQLRANGSPEIIARAEELVGGASAAATAARESASAPAAPRELSLDDNLNSDNSGDGGVAEGLDELDIADLSIEDLDADRSEGASDELDADAGDDVAGEEIEFEFLEIEEDSSPEVDGELDFGESDETLDLSDALVDVNANSGAEPSLDDNADDEGEDLLIADDADQMATKLDLARAYIDMGDSEGARGILDEVLEKGTAEQQQESRDLLSRIG
jgi:pilus assembly protein FimV